jgi:hypothetical protein
MIHKSGDCAVHFAGWEGLMFWFGKLNLETFSSFLQVHSKYGGIYHYELVSNGHTHTITLHH